MAQSPSSLVYMDPQNPNHLCMGNVHICINVNMYIYIYTAYIDPWNHVNIGWSVWVRHLGVPVPFAPKPMYSKLTLRLIGADSNAMNLGWHATVCLSLGEDRTPNHKHMAWSCACDSKRPCLA